MARKITWILSSLTGIILIVVACDFGWIQLGASSCNFVTNANGNRISWKTNLPMKFRLHTSVPEEIIPSLQKAADVWNEISSKTMISIVSTGYRKSASTRDQIPAIYWMTEWDSKKASEQGRTTIRWVQNQLVDADIKINAHNFDFFLEGEPVDRAKVDLVGLMIHEFGHALGFSHISNERSVMYYQLRRGYERRSANSGHVFHSSDVKSYQCEYGKDIVLTSFLDTVTSGNTTTSSASNL